MYVASNLSTLSVPALASGGINSPILALPGCCGDMRTPCTKNRIGSRRPKSISLNAFAEISSSTHVHRGQTRSCASVWVSLADFSGFIYKVGHPSEADVGKWFCVSLLFVAALLFTHLFQSKWSYGFWRGNDLIGYVGPFPFMNKETPCPSSKFSHPNITVGFSGASAQDNVFEFTVQDARVDARAWDLGDVVQMVVS